GLARDESLREQVVPAIDLLNRSERPVLFLGNGARNAHIKGLVQRLIDKLQIPVLVTWKMVDAVPNDCKFYAGRPGAIGQRAANFTQQNADWIMIVGARLDRPQTAFSYKNFARSAAKVLVDVDPAEIAKFDAPIDVPVSSDASQFIEEFLRQASKIVKRSRSCWLNRTRDWQSKYPVVLQEYWNT